MSTFKVNLELKKTSENENLLMNYFINKHNLYIQANLNENKKLF